TIVAIGIVVLGLGSIWYFGSENQTAIAAWNSYFGAFNKREPDKALEEVAKENAGSAAALWAKQALADMDLPQGAALLFSDRAEATRRLDKAKRGYEEVEAATTEPMLKSRARIGLGKVNEALCKPQEAERYYALVAETEKDTAIGKLAVEDVKRM